jgi:hypothetical protein
VSELPDRLALTCRGNAPRYVPSKRGLLQGQPTMTIQGLAIRAAAHIAQLAKKSDV